LARKGRNGTGTGTRETPVRIRGLKDVVGSTSSAIPHSAGGIGHKHGRSADAVAWRLRRKRTVRSSLAAWSCSCIQLYSIIALGQPSLLFALIFFYSAAAQRDGAGNGPAPNGGQKHKKNLGWRRATKAATRAIRDQRSWWPPSNQRTNKLAAPAKSQVQVLGSARGRPGRTWMPRIV
jgi:hypothetical protein